MLSFIDLGGKKFTFDWYKNVASTNEKMIIYVLRELASGLDFEIPTATLVRERIENALYCTVSKMDA